MNVEKLKSLRQVVVAAHADGALNMSTWALRGYDAVKMPRVLPGECGTTLCAAGWTAVMSGWEIIWLPFQRDARTCVKEGAIKEIEEVGAMELGLTPYEAEILFFSGDPEDGQDIEQAEVIQVMDALILREKKRPSYLEDLEAEYRNEEAARYGLLEWYHSQPEAP